MNRIEGLITKLSSTNEYARRSAAQELGEIGDDTCIEALKIAANDPVVAVKFQVEKALKKLTRKFGHLLEKKEAEQRMKHQQPVADAEKDEEGEGGGDVDDLIKEHLGGYEDKMAIKLKQEYDLDKILQVAKYIVYPTIPHLITNLTHDDPKVRSASASALAKNPDKQAVSPLIEALKKEKEDDTIALSLAELGDKEAVMPLIFELEDRKRNARDNIATALGELADERAVDSLIKILESEKLPAVRINAASALGQIRDVRAIEGLKKAYMDPDMWVSVNSVLSLGSMKEKSLLPFFEEIYAKEKSEPKKAAIVEAVGFMGDPGGMAIILKALKDRDRRIRANAVEAILSTPIKDNKKLEILLPYIQDSDNRVRGNAILACWSLGNQAVISGLAQMAVDSNKWMRATAAYCYKDILHPSGIDVLIKLFQTDRDADVRKNAVVALREYVRKEQSDYYKGVVSAHLVKGLRDPNSFIKINCSLVLGELGDPGNQRALLNLLKTENNKQVISAAINALGKIVQPSDIIILSNYLNDEDDRVRANAIEALDHLGSLEIIPYVTPLLHDTDNRVKANAALALWKLGEFNVIEILEDMLVSGNPSDLSSAAYAIGEIGKFDSLLQLSPRHLILLAALKAHSFYGRPEDEIMKRIERKKKLKEISIKKEEEEKAQEQAVVEEPQEEEQKSGGLFSTIISTISGITKKEEKTETVEEGEDTPEDAEAAPEDADAVPEDADAVPEDAEVAPEGVAAEDTAIEATMIAEGVAEEVKEAVAEEEKKPEPLRIEEVPDDIDLSLDMEDEEAEDDLLGLDLDEIDLEEEKEAEFIFEKDPKYFEILKNILLKKPDEAQQIIEKLPEGLDTDLLKIQHAKAKGDIALMGQLYEKIIADKTLDPNLYYNALQTFTKLKKMNEIFLLFRLIVDRNYQTFTESQALVEELIKKKDISLAFESGKFLMEVSPPKKNLSIKLGQYYTKLGNFSEATIHFKNYIRAFPLDPQGYHYLGISMIKDGNKEEGIELLKRILTITPKSNTVHQQIRKMLKL
ncbi:HEAT repeat domain-containing protein [Candidatus Riflebacteria bacterium]